MPLLFKCKAVVNTLDVYLTLRFSVFIQFEIMDLDATLTKFLVDTDPSPEMDGRRGYTIIKVDTYDAWDRIGDLLGPAMSETGVYSARAEYEDGQARDMSTLT